MPLPISAIMSELLEIRLRQIWSPGTTPSADAEEILRELRRRRGVTVEVKPVSAETRRAYDAAHRQIRRDMKRRGV